MIKSEFAWMNGKLLPFAQATTHVSAFTLHYGVAVFEGIRCYKRKDGKSAVFRLREHVERLITSAKICDMAVPYSREQIEAACLDTLVPSPFERGFSASENPPAAGRHGRRRAAAGAARRLRVPAKGLQGPVSTTGRSLPHRVPAEVADQFTQSSAPSAPHASWQDVGGGRAG
jgi:hypothetical protein